MSIIEPEIAQEQATMVDPPTQFGEYNFPSRDRIELYGDDQIVNVMWRGTVFNVSPGCFRAPRSIKWADFIATIVTPWAEKDPDFDAARMTAWKMDDTPFEPNDDDTLEGLGIEHKGVISFEIG